MANLSLQNDRGVSFWDQRRDNPHHTSKGHVDPDDQIVSTGLDVNPTTNQRPKHWATVWGKGEVGNGLTSGLRWEHIGDGTTN
ncbi:hypothetical protein WICPIJ_004559 [Wickerhamomyces pijperi]|uniref:Uncharacterized protein n=1 Tax=Wickerhamomyces pijperi TaxID=599730 RepID=A0A9P8Q7F0_WICPI|nr:hypothetical protein WICPIJ_004559 [Wickerhamomyces pijperi]